MGWFQLKLPISPRTFTLQDLSANRLLSSQEALSLSLTAPDSTEDAHLCIHLSMRGSRTP